MPQPPPLSTFAAWQMTGKRTKVAKIPASRVEALKKKRVWVISKAAIALGLHYSTARLWDIPKVGKRTKGYTKYILTADLIRFLDETGRVDWNAYVPKDSRIVHRQQVYLSRVKMLYNKPFHGLRETARILGVAMPTIRRWKLPLVDTTPPGALGGYPHLIRTEDIVRFLETTDRIQMDL